VRENQDADVGLAFADLLGGGSAFVGVGGRHLDIHHDEVGRRRSTRRGSSPA
jgi:hypothetical protein